jgi:hypothetical protein
MSEVILVTRISKNGVRTTGIYEIRVEKVLIAVL